MFKSITTIKDERLADFRTFRTTLCIEDTEFKESLVIESTLNITALKIKAIQECYSKRGVHPAKNIVRFLTTYCGDYDNCLYEIERSPDILKDKACVIQQLKMNQYGML